MIYTNSVKDLSKCQHILVLDLTTPQCVIELDFMLNDCNNVEEWINKVELVLAEYAVDHDLNYNLLNAKAIRFYND